MIRSLSARLLVALLVILMSVGVGLFWLAKWSSDRYHLEITQRLNAMIADYVVAEEQLLGEDGVNMAALEHVAHMAMVVNPVAEVYLLDERGNILAHALAARRRQRHTRRHGAAGELPGRRIAPAHFR